MHSYLDDPTGQSCHLVFAVVCALTPSPTPFVSIYGGDSRLPAFCVTTRKCSIQLAGLIRNVLEMYWNQMTVYYVRRKFL